MDRQYWVVITREAFRMKIHEVALKNVIGDRRMITVDLRFLDVRINIADPKSMIIFDF